MILIFVPERRFYTRYPVCCVIYSWPEAKRASTSSLHSLHPNNALFLPHKSLCEECVAKSCAISGKRFPTLSRTGKQLTVCHSIHAVSENRTVGKGN